jgi:hypothetical protein
VSLDKCLPGLERSGKVDVGRSKEARELYDELKRFYSRTHDEETAAALASEKTIERLEAADRRTKSATRSAMIEAQKAGAAQRSRMFNGEDPSSTGPLDPKRRQWRCSAFDGKRRPQRHRFLEPLRKRSSGQAHGMIDEILYRFHQNLIGNIRHRAELDERRA